MAPALTAPADVVRAPAFNVGTEKNNRSVAQIAQAVPGSVLEITGQTGRDTRSYRVDFSRAREQLGFEATWSIPDGAAELAREFVERVLTQDAFENTFTRLAALKRRQQEGTLDSNIRVVPYFRRFPDRRNRFRSLIERTVSLTVLSAKRKPLAFDVIRSLVSLPACR